MLIVSNFEKRICVNGSRSYNNYKDFSLCMNRILKWIGRDDLCIITGVASEGPDIMVIRWCCENKIDWFEYRADWDLFGKSAGYIRNCEMRDACTHLVSFWDKISKGTAHMIDECMKYDSIRTFVYLVEPDPDYYENKIKKKQW